MPRNHAHLRERALGMLQGGMRTADVARAINCKVRTVRRLRQCYRETGQTADRPRSGRPRVTTPAQDRYIWTSHLRDWYRMATTARVTPGTHNPFISAQTVRNRLREAGPRACRPVVRQFLTRHHRQQRCHKPTVAGPDRTGKKCSSLKSRGFVSLGVMVRFAFIVEGMSVTPRPVLWSWIDLEVWGGVSQHHRTELVVIAGNLKINVCCICPNTYTFLWQKYDLIIKGKILVVLFNPTFKSFSRHTYPEQLGLSALLKGILTDL
jgi:transposase